MSARVAVWFDAPGCVSVREAALSPVGPGDVVVRARLSAISAGTELLVYRGQWPEELPIDETIPSYRQPFVYPLTYGYAVVGVVEQVGADVDPVWIGRRVFAFGPHCSHVVTPVASVVALPDDLSDEQAVLLATTETAVTIALDAAPRIGERVAVAWYTGADSTPSLRLGISEDGGAHFAPPRELARGEALLGRVA
ncbi:MAG: alcohol dehydrogenase catalytic domain-containing protein, partial [Dehalococcoidia bacterium]|nr:alcohol dehydrogenase catalytic domain-containing protein [Dehalococcoidia bacterium]